jgi:hypothetical protein
MKLLLYLCLSILPVSYLNAQTPASQTRNSVITGKVKTSKDKPVVGELVQLIPLDSQGRPKGGMDAASQRMFMDRVDARTDDRGQYRLWNLQAGRYLVAVGRVSDELIIGEHKRYFRQTFHPAKTQVSEAKIIDLAEGQEAENVDITLSEPLPTYSISGLVLDETTKRPAVGVMVGYQYQREGKSAFTAGPTTDGNGRFRIDGVTPGPYEFFVPAWNNTYASTAPVSFTIRDQSVGDLQILVTGMVTLLGTAIIEGGPQAGDAEAFSRLSLSLRRSVTGRHPDSNFIWINPDGSFQASLLPGKYTISTPISPSDRPVLQRFEINGEPQSGGFTIEAQSQPYQARLVFGRTTGSVQGQVVAPQNVQGRITVIATSATFTARPTVAGADGSFRFDNLPLGDYNLIAQMSLNGKMVAIGKQKTTIQSGAAITVTIQLSEVPQ